MKNKTRKGILRLLAGSLVLSALLGLSSCSLKEPDFSDPNLDVDKLYKTWQYKYYAEKDLPYLVDTAIYNFIASNGDTMQELLDTSALLNKFTSVVDKHFIKETGAKEVSEHIKSIAAYFEHLNQYTKGEAGFDVLMSDIQNIDTTQKAIDGYADIFQYVQVQPDFVPTGQALSLANLVKEKSKVRTEQDYTITIGGNTMLGNPANNWEEGFNKQYYKNGKDPYYPFAKCIPYFANDNLTLLSYEGTFATGDAKVENGFKGFEEYVSSLKEGGIDVASLATEHADDFYELGRTETLQTFNNAGIRTFNDGQPLTINTPLGSIAFLSYNVAETELDMKLILRDEVKAAYKNGALITIVNFNWGNIDNETVSNYQKKYARIAIDAGADIVFGSHPYVMQGIEYYKDKPIIYSMGNLCNGGDINNDYKDSFLFRIKITKEGEETFNFKDFEIIPLVTSTPGKVDYMPTPVSGEEADRIANKIKELSSQLENPVQDFAYTR